MHETTRLLRDLVALPSVNPMGRPLSGPGYLEAGMTDYLDRWFRALGVPFERQSIAPGRENLLARFESASTVVPLLAKDGCVVLVAGNLPGAATPDDRHARIDLLRVLARAILAECEGADVRAVVVGNDRSPADIADIARRRGDVKTKKAAEVAALPGDLNYADWQREFLSLTTNEE